MLRGGRGGATAQSPQNSLAPTNAALGSVLPRELQTIPFSIFSVVCKEEGLGVPSPVGVFPLQTIP